MPRNAFESDASAQSVQHPVRQFSLTPAYRKHISDVQQYLELRNLPRDGSLQSNNVDTLWQHHLCIAGLSIRNYGRIMQAHTSNDVDTADGSRNHAKPLRDGLRHALPLFEPVCIASRAILACDNAPALEADPAVMTIEHRLVQRYNAVLNVNDHKRIAAGI